MAISMKDHAHKIGSIGKVYGVATIPWPIRVQVIDVRENFGQVEYLVGDAGTNDGPTAWVKAERVRMEQED